MWIRKHLLFCALSCYLFSRAQGQLGPVLNVTVSPILYEESSAVNVTWLPPTKTNGEDPSTFTYNFEYCRLNLPDTCKNMSLTSTSAEAKTLMTSDLYQYKITVFDSKMIAGETLEGTFRTAARDTCRSTHFTCGSPQCALKERLCNGIPDCVDGSDETIRAGCSLPRSKVTGVTGVSKSPTSIEITWNKITNLNDFLKSYQISNDNTSLIGSIKHPKNQPAVTTLSYTFDGLLSNKMYYFKVRSVNGAGNGPWSDTISVQTQKAEKVGAVFNVTFSDVLYEESTSIKVSWMPPINDNGEDPSTFTYNFEYCRLNLPDTCKNMSLNNTSVEIKELTPLDLHQYKVTVFDSQKVAGEISEGTFKTKQRDTCRSNQFTCGSPQCVPNDRKCNGIVDCADGSDERKDAGCSPPGKEDIPDAMETAPGSVTITWNKPRINTDFIVRFEVQNINTEQVKSAIYPINQPAIKSLSVVFTGLAAGIEHSFILRGVNEAGSGDWSDPKKIRTKVGAVTNVTVHPILYKERTAVRIGWMPPKYQVGLNVSTLLYNVTYCELNLPDTCKTTELSSQTFLEVFDLDSRHLYQYVIHVYTSNLIEGDIKDGAFRTAYRDTCRNDSFACGNPQCVANFKKCNGRSDCADGSDETSKASCQLPTRIPKILLAKATSKTSVQITFSVIKYQPDRIKTYQVQNTNTSSLMDVRVPPLSPATVNLSATFNDVLPGRYFIFRVRAVNPTGYGDWSTPESVKTPSAAVGLIGPVENVKSRAVLYSEATAVNITWSAPSELKNNSLDSLTYVVRYCKGIASCSTPALQMSKNFLEISGLIERSTYTYIITVYNENGEHDPSLFYKGTFSTSALDTCRSTWHRCVVGHKCIQPDRVCNGRSDCGDASDEKVGAGCAPPPDVKNFIVRNTTYHTITLQFKAIIAPSHRITGYEVQNYVTNEKKRIDQGLVAFRPPIQVTFNNLKFATHYQFRVVAVNPSGVSLQPAMLDTHTVGAATGPVQNLKIVPKPQNEIRSVILTWDPPKNLFDNDVDELKYYVRFCRLNLQNTCKFTQRMMARMVEIGDLNRGDLYQFGVYTVNKYNVSSEILEKAYMTKSELTCLSNQFQCSTKRQCVHNKFLCDGIMQCAGGSDETADGNCTKPVLKPTSVTVKKATTTSITIQFKQVLPQDRAKRYDIRLTDTKTNEVKTNSVPATLAIGAPKETEFSNLIPGSSFVAQVRAVNLVGYGPWSSEVEVETVLEQPKTKPEKITVVNKTVSEFILTFEQQVSDGAAQYQVEIQSGDTTWYQTFNKTDPASKEMVTIKGLQPGKTYSMRVRAMNELGMGPWSQPFTAKTVPGTDTSDDDGGLNTGEIVGIVIAAVLVLIIITLIVVYVRKSKSHGAVRFGKDFYGIENGVSNGFDNSAYEMDKK